MALACVRLGERPLEENIARHGPCSPGPPCRGAIGERPADVEGGGAAGTARASVSIYNATAVATADKCGT
jgi:hypothetical protein